MDPVLMKEQMLAINQKLLFGPTLLAKSQLRAGTILRIPDTACELHSTVNKYLGFSMQKTYFRKYGRPLMTMASDTEWMHRQSTKGWATVRIRPVRTWARALCGGSTAALSRPVWLWGTWWREKRQRSWRSGW